MGCGCKNKGNETPQQPQTQQRTTRLQPWLQATRSQGNAYANAVADNIFAKKEEE